jgi:hypothetical protein
MKPRGLSVPVRWRRLPLVLMAVFLALVAAAPAASKEERRRRVEELARVKRYPPCAWEDAHVYESKSYVVRTNTSKEVAVYVGQLMDFAQKHYRRVFGYDGPVPRMRIHAYRSDAEYQVVASRAGLAGSTGFFAREGEASTIHLAYTDTLGERQPTVTLLHEGAHQFVSVALDFPIPQSQRQYFANGLTTLPSVPLWLNEGMATYMEMSYYDGEKLVVGEVNRNRLRQLQWELRDGRHIPLAQLLCVESPDRFGSSHYAAAWGLTYWFLEDADPRRKRAKRRILGTFIDACRRGFMADPEADLMALIRRPGTFQEKWTDHVARRGYETFIDMTIGRDGSIGKWEEVWKEWILALDPDQPYGGLRD